MQLSTFGSLTATVDGMSVQLGRPKQRLLLALLIIDANRAVPADRLVQLLWGGTSGDKERAALHAFVSDLRKALEPGRGRGSTSNVIMRDGAGYRLAVDRQDVDVHRFEDLIATARRHRLAGDGAAALTELQDAIALWTGPPFSDVDHHAVVSEAVARWRWLLQHAVSEAAALQDELGNAVNVPPPTSTD